MNQVTVEGFGRYFVNVDGQVYASHIDKYLNSYNNGIGYLQVKMRNEITKKRHSFFVHRLVAMCYLENVDDLSDVNHIDGDKTNNHMSNLEWASRHDNMKHAFDNKLLKGFVAEFY